jgi:hypothetical protein
VESLKPHLEFLTPLTNLASRVEAFAALCLPDFVYTDSETRDMAFVEIDLAPFVGDRYPEVRAAISLREDGQTTPYAFTKWSRSQLLSHLGAREKWFETVTRGQEVSELNIRLHALRNFMFRTMRSFDSDELRLVRGIVSSKYADLPDTAIMKALTDLMPDGYAVAAYSGKTDRAFYAYAITADKIGIPGTSFHGFPGVVLKNSEVGFTSLWIIPMLYLANYGVPIVLKKQAVLRRIHRGDIANLTKRFEEALQKTQVLWGPLEEKLAKLRTITYSSEDVAVAAMTEMLEAAGSERLFAHRCETKYRASSHTVHDAFGLFEAILANVKTEADQDAAYVSAELAGAVLMQLIK